MSVPIERKQPKGLKKFLSGARWIVLVGLVVLVGLGVAITRDFFRKAKISQEIEQLEGEIGGLERRNEELKGLISYFESDSFKEREARAKLNVQKPGEKVIEVAEPKIKASLVEPEVVQQAVEPATNPGRWWLYFFSKKI